MAAAMGRRAGLGASKFPAPPYGRKLIFGSTLGLSAPETDRRVLGVLEWTCANFRVAAGSPFGSEANSKLSRVWSADALIGLSCKLQERCDKVSRHPGSYESCCQICENLPSTPHAESSRSEMTCPNLGKPSSEGVFQILLALCRAPFHYIFVPGRQGGTLF